MTPDPREEDELDLFDDLSELPALPPLEGRDETMGLVDAEDDEDLAFGDESSDGADVDDGGHETAGLDDVGLDDVGLDDVGLDEGARARGDHRATLERGAAPSLLEDVAAPALELGEDEVGGGDEYGWTGDDEAPGTSAADFLDDVEEVAAATEDDGGEEGVEETSSLAFRGDDELSGLPPLRGEEADGDADDLDIEDDGAIELDLPFEDEARLTGVALAPVRPARSRFRFHGEVLDLGAEGETLYLAGDELVRLEPRAVEACAAAGLQAEELLAVSVCGDVVVVGTRLGGAFRSVDAGRSFVPANGWRSGNEPSVGCRVAGDAAGRLWLWAGGALYRSDDFGARWAGPVLPAPVVTACLDDRGALVVATGSLPGGVDVLRATDDGRGFRALLPTVAKLSREGGELSLAVSGDRVAIAPEGDPEGLFVSQGGRWFRVPELAGCHAVTWVGETLYGATHVAAGDRGLVVRCAFNGGTREVSIVFELDALSRGPSGSSGMRPREHEWVGDGLSESHRIHGLWPRGSTLLVGCGAGLVELALEEASEPS